MIRHIVLVRFAATTGEAERNATMAGLQDLRTSVPGMLAYAGGANVSPEGLAAGFTHAFTMDFANAAARDAYLVHPAHVKVAARLVAAADGDGSIVVVDLHGPDA